MACTPIAIAPERRGVCVSGHADKSSPYWHIVRPTSTEICVVTPTRTPPIPATAASTSMRRGPAYFYNSVDALSVPNFGSVTK